MKEALFDIPEQKSPRLLWMEKHEVAAKFDIAYGEWLVYSLAQGANIEDAWNNHKPFLGIGAIEADAITDWARKNNVRLWNEVL